MLPGGGVRLPQSTSRPMKRQRLATFGSTSWFGPEQSVQEDEPAVKPEPDISDNLLLAAPAYNQPRPIQQEDQTETIPDNPAESQPRIKAEEDSIPAPAHGEARSKRKRGDAPLCKNCGNHHYGKCWKCDNCGKIHKDACRYKDTTASRKKAQKNERSTQRDQDPATEAPEDPNAGDAPKQRLRKLARLASDLAQLQTVDQLSGILSEIDIRYLSIRERTAFLGYLLKAGARPRIINHLDWA